MASSYRLLLSLVVLLACFHGSLSEGEAETAAEPEIISDVLVLTDENFDEAIKDNENILVEFYAPWCGHCKALEPEYEAAAKKLREEGSAIRLAKLDGTVHKKAVERFSLKGYPTIKFFSNGEETEYSGGRTSKSIIAWLSKRTGPPAVALPDVDAAKTFVGDRSVAIIGFFPDETTEQARGFLKSAQDAPDDLRYGLTSSSDVAKEYGIESEFGIVAVRTFDEPQVQYDQDNYTAEAISAFARLSSMPYVIEFSQDNAAKIFSGVTKRQFLYFGSKQSEDYESHVAVLLEQAKKHKGEMLFVTFNTDEEENVKILDVFGLSNTSVPAVRIIELAARDMKKYQPETGEITADVIAPFIEGVNDGSIKQSLKSEEIPEDWDAKPVKQIVGKNFNDVIINNEKHALIQFYAPWCGHCKKLMPVWDEVGEYFDGRDDHVVGKMDATANEVEGLKIESFPTIYYFLPNGKSRPIKYTGKRELEALLVFAEGGGRDGGRPDHPFPVPAKPKPEPADFEAEDEEDLPLEETEEEKEILAEAEQAAAEAEEMPAKEEL
uniref:Protein disulfide-isomerase n=1 Tax=Sycon ciliatum TaxID=27933 RepID=M1XMR5_9METZ|nr:Protein disulfide isomerase [Sycon ciliatum]|eukprot:scpid50977/ scgid28234/ Protein disulfide-isomerase 2; PDI 1; Prolyl 4-hydroxylase subunit beta-2